MSSGGVTIRPARASDFEDIVALWSAAGLDAKHQGRDSRESFRFQLTRFSTTYLVAHDEDRLIGVVLGTHDWRKGWINRLAVHPVRRRAGVARQLIEACERAFRDLGIEIFAALVERHNTVSATVFQRTGYKDDIPVHYFHKRLGPEV